MRSCVVGLVVLSAAALAQEPEDYKPIGSVSSNGRVTTFSADRVVSPVANLTRRPDGSWAGQLLGQPMDFTVSPEGMHGVNLNLAVSKKGGVTRVEGLVFFKPFRLVMGRDKIDVRVGSSVQQFVREKDGSWRTLSMATPYTLKLEGEAAAESPPLPQVVAAFVANGA